MRPILATLDPRTLALLLALAAALSTQAAASTTPEMAIAETVAATPTLPVEWPDLSEPAPDAVQLRQPPRMVTRSAGSASAARHRCRVIVEFAQLGDYTVDDIDWLRRNCP